MTKGELIEFLLPFTDDIDVMLTNGKHHYEIDHAEYGMRQNGEGKAMLTIGARALQTIRFCPGSSHRAPGTWTLIARCWSATKRIRTLFSRSEC